MGNATIFGKEHAIHNGVKNRSFCSLNKYPNETVVRYDIPMITKEAKAMGYNISKSSNLMLDPTPT